MILDESLGEPAASAETTQRASGVTIDALFRRLVQRRPDALALADPTDRARFTGGEPRRLSFAEADRVVTAMAAQFRRMGLSTDAIVGVQLPNIVENVLVTLAILRAGMIVAPLPLLWRRVDAVAALARVGAKALITCGRLGAFNHGQAALTVAADVFSIRYVCAFGTNLPDGIVSLDELFTAAPHELPPLKREQRDNATAHIAAVTFDVAPGGLVPVARSHAELLAGGLAVLLESGLAEDAGILSTMAPASFAGLCLTLLPWLLTGGALVLHHPFDPGVLARQQRSDRCATLVVPGALAFRLAATTAFAVEGPATVIAAWRSPERLAASATWREASAALVDVAIFGETALVPGRRDASGKASALPLGPLAVPRGGADATVVAELARTDAGTLAARGPMAPHHAFPPGIERSGLPYCKIGARGLVDTGYLCRVETGAETVTVTGPPAGIASVGGYRFPLADLQDVVGRIDSRATLAALPDPVLGQRLIGNARDRDMVRAALGAVGVNPLVVEAFRDRSTPATDAA